MRRPVCLSFACLSLAVAALWPQTASADIVPHRAEYSLRLGPAANAVRVGTAIHDLDADCAGWRLKRDINVELSLTSAWKLAVGSKLDGEEARGGSSFRYRVTQIQNGNERHSQGRVQRREGEVRAEIAGGSPAQFALPAATLMPVQAIGHLVDRLRGGALSFPALTYDAEVIGDGFLVDVEVLDRAALRVARPTDRQVLPPDGKSWPVSLTFTRGRQQQQNPLFTVTALMWETGILDRLTVNTGMVSVTADLQTLDIRKTPHCPRS